MTKDRPLLVLDLDGTLADTIRDLIPVLNRVTAQVGLPAIDMADVGHVVGHGARAMLARAFAFHGKQVEETVIEGLFRDFLIDYENNIARETVLFDGVPAALDRFAGDGWRLAVCTNKAEHLARLLIDELGQGDRFAAITGGDTFDFRKPDPRHLTETVRLAGGNPLRSVMVGDSSTDIRTAKAAGIPVVAVDFGYADMPVDRLGADRVISHYDELRAAVAEMAAARGW
ncbi:MAG: HAD-IA family hydrolase [Pseudomonadota bacterium]|nr:HAD-IA family hydrolase [Pseudomonadota bacterium]